MPISMLIYDTGILRLRNQRDPASIVKTGKIWYQDFGSGTQHLVRKIIFAMFIL